MVDPRRIRARNDQLVQVGAPVLYWMQRDQRVQDNWALLYAAQCAAKAKQPLLVVFNLVSRFGETTARHYDFMFRGLEEVETELRALGILFHLITGNPRDSIPTFVRQYQIGHVVTDFNPLRFTDDWRTVVGNGLKVRLTEVDAHNVVPAWCASPKLEFAAHTLRPKIHRLLPDFLTPIPRLTSSLVSGNMPAPIDWELLRTKQVINYAVEPVTWLKPGSQAGLGRLGEFCRAGLADYATERNDPVLNNLSHLSPYLHFGQIGAQRVALSISASQANRESRDAYLEELIVRRELADNYCLYNPDYDKVTGAHAWAQSTIGAHATDKRDYMYTIEQFETGETHDDLWNAAQQQMVQTGKMHGFMRMYWAKKILEWTPDAQTAIDTALYLNDKYELDGTDPSGITGVMWSICGVHDRAWTERPVFGKIRYMNYNGCKRKFNLAEYVDFYPSNSSQALFDSDLT